MKTIKEIAEEIGVSKQTVYKRYRDKLYKTVMPYARMNNGTIYISDEGESIIKHSFLSAGSYTEPHTNHIQEAIILMLQKELKAKNRHIAELTHIIRAQTKSVDRCLKAKYKGQKKLVKQRKTFYKIEAVLNPNKNTCLLPEQLASPETPQN